MTRIQIYDSIELLDHFADHEKILGLTSGEVELLSEMRSDLIWRLRDDRDEQTNGLRMLRGCVRVAAPGPGDD